MTVSTTPLAAYLSFKRRMLKATNRKKLRERKGKRKKKYVQAPRDVVHEMKMLTFWQGEEPGIEGDEEIEAEEA